MIYNELYPESYTNGIGLLTDLSGLPNIPWREIEDVANIERLYSLRSGFKRVTPAFVFPDAEIRAKMIAHLFADKWTRLWHDFKAEYSPLDAYRVDETVTRDRDDSNNSTDNYGRKIEESHTDGGTVATNESTVSVADSNIYGFNSDSAVPADRTSGNDSGTSTETRNLESTDSTTNSGSDSRISTHTEDETTTTTRHGNIGYTTPQELLRQDIELWHTPFFNLVFDDIDTFIMIQVYSI